jgi:hypothetical protein
VNTKDNTPAVIHTEIVPGDEFHITVLPKGGGCENMSRLQIMLPSRGKEGITEFVLRTIEESGGNPCPPLVVGVGVGGSAEYCMLLAKKAITREVGRPSSEQRSGGRGVREGAAGEGERAGRRSAGGRRREHRPGGEHRDVSDAHHVVARGGEHPVPQRAVEAGVAVGWSLVAGCLLLSDFTTEAQRAQRLAA